MEFNRLHIQAAIERLNLEKKYGYSTASWRRQTPRGFAMLGTSGIPNWTLPFLVGLIEGKQPASWDEKPPDSYYTYRELLQNQTQLVNWDVKDLIEAKRPDQPCSWPVQAALESHRRYAKPEGFWNAVLAGEEVAAMRQTRQPSRKPTALEQLESAAFATLGRMDTFTAKLAYEQAKAKSTSAGVANPVLVAFSTSDRFYVTKWKKEMPEGRFVQLAVPEGEFQQSSWELLSDELCEDLWVSPEVFIVDADRYPVYTTFKLGSVGYSGP